MVYYRKYRPQKIEELDSKSVRDKLYSVLGNSSVSHAFLFTGPKGLGKTSTARIVAKALNCEKRWDVGNEKIDVDVRSEKIKVKKNQKIPPQNPASNFPIPISSIEPCNKCEQCVSIMRGTNLDILEIDGASNRGIDEIRDLREKVKLSPLSARKKVYIIDEVHMLTQEAFNALLKTLEEPPSHVVFVLCTTEPQKVPATIMSRCVNIKFTRATEEELVRSFERIALVEKLKFDKEALSLIASLSDGSFRDGAKILEEIAPLAGRKKITKDLVEKQYQISNIKYQITKMIEILEKKDTKSGLELTSKLTDQGTDMKFFMEELVSELHAMLLAKVGIKIDANKTELTIENIKHLIELSGKAIPELKYAILPQLPLELVIVEWGVQKTQMITQKPGSSGSQTVRQSVAQSFPSVPKMATRKEEAFWKELIDKVKLYNHSIAGVLRGCRVKSYDGKSLIIEAKFKFHKERLSERKTQEILEQACKEITKKNIKVEVLLKAR